MGERGRWNRQVIDPGSRKAPDAERLLEHELVLDNATFRLLEAAPAWTRYLVLDFRFTALSDEKREGMQRLAINLATGAMPEAIFDRIGPWLAERRGRGRPLPEDADAASRLGSAGDGSRWCGMPCRGGWRRRWRPS